MKEIKFPNGLKTIGGGAFNTIDIIEDKETRPVDYDQMYTVYLPETVTHIGTTAFPNASAIHMSKQTAKCLMNESSCGVWKPRLYSRKRIRRGGFTKSSLMAAN